MSRFHERRGDAMRIVGIARGACRVLLLGALLASCSGSSGRDASGAAPDPKPRGAAHAAVTFVNRVWGVVQSPTVPIGQLYVFLSDGTLLVTSLHGTPSLGRWSYEHGKLSLTEQGVTYAVEIGELTAERFRITLNGPGEPVTMTLAPAEGAAIAD